MPKTDLTSLIKFVESSERSMIDLERLLTQNPALAPENGGKGELKKAVALENWLKEQGFSDIKHFDAPDFRAEGAIRPNVVVTIPGISDEYCVWSMAHLDVVPVGEKSLWKTDPWTVVEKDGRLYGRGVEDNQQGLVSSVFAALAFVKLGIKPLHTVKLLFMADEEVGSKYGIIWLLENTNLFKKNDLILIPDGGDSNGETIEVAEKNLLWLKLNVKGKQSHGSRPDQGCNACLAANDLSLRLHFLQNVFNKKDSLFEPNYSTFQPTMRLANVEGVNIIPGEDTFFMDCRILPCYPLNEVLLEVKLRCSDVEKDYGVKVELEIPQMSESPATSIDCQVVKKLKEAIFEAHGINARTIGIGGGTVGAELRRKGFDCAVWSSLDETAHMPNEYCIVSNMIKDAKTLVYFFAI